MSVGGTSPSQGAGFDRSPVKMNMATAAAACGAASLVLLVIPGLVVVAPLLAVLGIVLGAVALGPARRSQVRDGSVARAVAGIGLGGVAALVLVVLAVAAVRRNEDEAEAQAPAQAPASLDELLVGDCIVGAGRRSFQTVSCEDEHDGEVFLVSAASEEEEHPGLAALDEQAFSSCDGRLAGYVGPEARSRRLTRVAFCPDEDGWADGLRAIVCAAVRPDGTTLTNPVGS